MEIKDDLPETWRELGAAVDGQRGLAFATGFISLVLTSCLVLSLYCLYWSPLAKYPGPRLCAVSRLLWAWYEVNGGMAKWIRSLHLIHGDIVRVAPDELSFANGTAWNDIYGVTTQDRKATGKEQNFRHGNFVTHLCHPPKSLMGKMNFASR